VELQRLTDLEPQGLAPLIAKSEAQGWGSRGAWPTSGPPASTGSTRPARPCEPLILCEPYHRERAHSPPPPAVLEVVIAPW